MDTGEVGSESGIDGSSVSLLSLPLEVLRHIMTYSTIRTLAALSETNQELNALCMSDALWRELTRRRFRLSPRPTLPRRFEMSGGVCWRTLYSNWHRQMRMPVSRHSGPTFKAFARSRTAGVAVWLTVVSAEDCRLRAGALRAHIIVQNVGVVGRGDGIAEVRAENIGICVGGDVGVVTVAKPKTSAQVALKPASVEELVPSGKDRLSDKRWRLGLDEFVILPLEVRIAGTEVEVDALERLQEVTVPVVVGEEVKTVVAKLSDKAIWDAYDLLPGGWWARVG